MKRGLHSHGRVSALVLLLSCAALVLGGVAWMALAPEPLPPQGEARELAPGHAAGVLSDPAARALPAGALPEAEARAESRREELLAARSAASEPVEPRAFAGRVVESGTLRPLEDAEVELVREDVSVVARSDAEGGFRAVWLAAEEPHLEVRRSGFATVRRPSVAFDEPAELRLARGAQLTVLVFGPDTEALAATSVRLGDDNARGNRGEAAHELTPDAQGRCVFADLPQGEYSVAVAAPGFSLATERGVVVSSGEHSDVPFDLTRGGTLYGKVWYEGGTDGVEGAVVRLRPERRGVSGSSEKLAALECETAADGSYELTGVSLGTCEVEVRAPWGARTSGRVELPEEDGRLERHFRLPGPAALSGRVLDELGKPASGAAVLVTTHGEANVLETWRRARRPRQETWRVDCAEDGSFALEGLPAKRTVYVSAALLDPESRRPRALSALRSLRLSPREEREDQELLLRPLARIVGRVMDRDGQPLAGASVAAAWLRGRSELPWTSTKAEPDGSYELYGLLADAYALRARHEDCYGQRQEVEAQTGSILTLDFELERTLSCRVHVLDEEGNAVPSARVAVFPSVATVDWKKPVASARCDRFGQAELQRMKEGAWLLRPSARGYEAAGPPGRIVLPGEELAVLSLRRSPPPERCTVIGRVVQRSNNQPARGIRIDGPGGALEVDTGVFRLTGVHSGRRRLIVHAEGCVSVKVGPMELPPGGTVDVGELRLDPATRLEVVVKDGSGKRLDGARVVLRRAHAKSKKKKPRGTGPSYDGRSTRGGRYVVAAVPRGKCVLFVRKKGYKGHVTLLNVKAQRTQSVTVTLRR